ncbi:hypothetical protein LWC35_08625 [Pseudonocardia kujensis]|uniref:hypothetical protein n=1 Tax=Pseudonocardia kujensis TaxID=1128675 RepID=UPI001E5AB57B|nr:hypothetical protein [Pseudonocardia kujensis]MCE0762978.1 hypothetical protein [Pseudonocardia kujensis]
MRHLIVDGANVVGSRPDGWWRDRAGAASRLAAQLADARDAGVLASLGDRILLVLEGAAKRAEVPEGLEVLLAPADGDSAMVELAHDLGERDEDVCVVTADRELTRLLHAVGASTAKPGALLALLDP